MASITNVIRISVQDEGSAVLADNMNVVGIITGNQGVLSSAERYRAYRTAAGVANDFGSSSVESAFANTFFSTSPNPVSSSGLLIIGYWRASDEDVAASAATLVSEQTTDSVLIPVLNGITDGSFTITVDDLTDNSAVLGMLWENAYVGVKFNTPTDKGVEASIAKVKLGKEK